MTSSRLGASKSEPEITLWYGDVQRFGIPGLTQKYINVLGTVTAEAPITEASFSLNRGPQRALQLGPDLRRLARPGDFNIEVESAMLDPGANSCVIRVIDAEGATSEKHLVIEVDSGGRWPLPWRTRFDPTRGIQETVQILDGLWRFTSDGIRTVEPYYDRAISFGDGTWSDYEVHAAVTFHGFAPPEPGPPTYGVTHAALALRWPGFDADEFLPHRKWYPLGATCEFTLTSDQSQCAFRILGGGDVASKNPVRTHEIELGSTYHMRARVETGSHDRTRYRAAFGRDIAGGFADWDIELLKEHEPIKRGCGLAIAHHTDVTFHSIRVMPL